MKNWNLIDIHAIAVPHVGFRERGKIFLLILLTFVSSCETEKIIFKGPFHVRFTDVARTEKESNSKIIKVEVHNAGPALENDVTITYSISGSAREGVDFNIVGTRGKVTIKKNKYFGYIEVQLINNANNILRSQDLILTLARVNSSELEVGQGDGGIGKKFTLTILDDCILGGTYNGTQRAFSIPTKILPSPVATAKTIDCQIGMLTFLDRQTRCR